MWSSDTTYCHDAFMPAFPPRSAHIHIVHTHVLTIYMLQTHTCEGKWEAHRTELGITKFKETESNNGNICDHQNFPDFLQRQQANVNVYGVLVFHSIDI